MDVLYDPRVYGGPIDGDDATDTLDPAFVQADLGRALLNVNLHLPADVTVSNIEVRASCPSRSGTTVPSAPYFITGTGPITRNFENKKL